MTRNGTLSLPLALALALGACSGSSGGNQDRPSPSAPASAPTGPTDRDAASLSGEIAFSAGSYPGNMDVYVVRADGTHLRKLTSSRAAEFDPSWSPDGTRIAYRSEPGGEQEIWVMNADGSGQHRLTGGLSPAWSPDGSLIAFSAPGSNRDGSAGNLAVIRSNGTGLRVLPHTEGGEYPSWSPDGTRIAFNSNLTGQHVMSIAQADGSKAVELPGDEGWQVDWSPDGRSILFASGRDQTEPGYTDVYVMRPDGSDLHRLTHSHAYTPAWSPDGEHVVFSAPGLFVMDADGHGVRALPTPGLGETSLPDWTD